MNTHEVPILRYQICKKAHTNMDWDDYRYFLAIEQAGSVLVAAKGLGVNHTTVLPRIR